VLSASCNSKKKWSGSQGSCHCSHLAKEVFSHTTTTVHHYWGRIFRHFHISDIGISQCFRISIGASDIGPKPWIGCSVPIALTWCNCVTSFKCTLYIHIGWGFTLGELKFCSASEMTYCVSVGALNYSLYHSQVLLCEKSKTQVWSKTQRKIELDCTTKTKVKLNLAAIGWEFPMIT